jgi:hypothetical protein
MSVDCTTHGRSVIQAEVKRCSLVGLGIGPDASPVLSDDALHCGKSHAGAFKLFVGVKPLKCSKKLLGIFRIESGAIVANEKHRFAIVYGRRTPYRRLERLSEPGFQKFAQLRRRLELWNGIEILACGSERTGKAPDRPRPEFLIIRL